MTETLRKAPQGLVGLIDANQALWAAEAEVCSTYFASPARSRRSDLRWLARQAAKELIDGVVPRADELGRLLASGEGASHADLLASTTEELAEEAAHFAAFTAAYDQLRHDDSPVLDFEVLTRAVAWPENLALASTASSGSSPASSPKAGTARCSPKGCGWRDEEGPMT